jgi:hypothetical protein
MKTIEKAAPEKIAEIKAGETTVNAVYNALKREKRDIKPRGKK